MILSGCPGMVGMGERTDKGGFETTLWLFECL